MPRDRWAAWFAERRHGGDEKSLATILDASSAVRDGVLEGAGIKPGDVVLDIGCGDGLIGLAALEHVGDDGVVIFDDLSDELLDRCRERARGDERCRFVNASVTELPFEDGSVDVVTGAAVLIYVAEKQRAFDELHRVLRPGGRLSLYEPLNSFGYPESAETFFGIEVGEMRPLTERVRDVWRGIDLPEYAAMHNWNERDLLEWAQRAGFATIRYYAAYGVMPADPVPDYEARARKAGNPLVPSLAEAIDEALSAEEAELLVAWLAPRMEAGDGVQWSAEGFLTATK
jgi:ubiquinone/menaquinone biosynthesis C-methylase UbiE